MPRALILLLLLIASCTPHIAQQPIAPEISGMAFVEGGCFRMGDRFNEGYEDEKPVHKVCLEDYYMDITEVTQKQYTALIGGNPSVHSNCPNCPVDSVSWFEAEAFCRNKGKLLPTEAQWEFAAQSRGHRHLYSGQDKDHNKYAWTDANSDATPHPVGEKEPNAIGIYDMSGNVWEWVQDWHDEKYYTVSPRVAPTGPLTGVSRVWRGGSWYDVPWVARTSARYQAAPESKISRTGFRCVKVIRN
jgi:sulfatase modifying factor 1